MLVRTKPVPKEKDENRCICLYNLLFSKSKRNTLQHAITIDEYHLDNSEILSLCGQGVTCWQSGRQPTAEHDSHEH